MTENRRSKRREFLILPAVLTIVPVTFACTILEYQYWSAMKIRSQERSTNDSDVPPDTISYAHAGMPFHSESTYWKP